MAIHSGRSVWLRELFSSALLLDRLDCASEWVESTGCILLDLLDDDGFTDLVEHLDLKKFESKRLRKALKLMAPGCSSGIDVSVDSRDASALASGYEAPTSHMSTVSLSVDDAEPEPERLLPPSVGNESSLLLSPVKPLDDDALSSFSLMLAANTEAPTSSSPVAESHEGEHILSMDAKETWADSSSVVAPSELEPPSPRKALARHLLEKLEDSEKCTDVHDLGSINTMFENPADVFAAFESFGPGAVAMFEYDEEARRFGLTTDAKNIFRELGISRKAASGSDDIRNCLDALEAGTKQELCQFLATFLRDSHQESSSVSEPEPCGSPSIDHAGERPALCPDVALESCQLSQSSDLTAGEDSFAPTTSIQAQVISANASTRNILLQKRVVDKGHRNKRAAIALELWDQQGLTPQLLAQLDVMRLIEIRPMTTSLFRDDISGGVSFILTAHVDAVFHLQPDEKVRELFHSLDAGACDRLSLHVAIGPSKALQEEANRFFSGLRLLARLPSDCWQRLAADPSSADSVLSTPRSKSSKGEPSAGRGGTLKVDLSSLLQECSSGPSSQKEGSRSGRSPRHRASSKEKIEKVPTPRSSGPVIIEKDILFNACHTRWNVVVDAARDRGWKVVTSDDEARSCNIHWVDDGSMKEVAPHVHPWMRVNHFPGTCRVLGRKCRLARTMSRMQMLFPDEYGFIPRTWVLPEDFPDLSSRVSRDAEMKGTYIVKPDGLSQGRGIFLTDDLDRLRKCSEECREKGEGVVVQKYISRPMLLDGLKFDMRIYLLVVGGETGVGTDMRLFLFREGIVRLCTAEYMAPTPETFDQVHMHITNYEVNRHSSSFKNPTSSAQEDCNFSNKRSLSWFFDFIEAQYGPAERQRIWSDVVSICVKTLLASQPTLGAEYDASFSRDPTKGSMGCRSFEILGFDVMLNSQRKAYLLEVNHLPSLGCHSALDYSIKRRLVDQTLDITCGCVDDHIINKATYEQLVSTGQTIAPGSSRIDLPSYKDFDCVFPPSQGCPEGLGSIAMTISEKVQGVFGSVMSSRPRATITAPNAAAPNQRARTPRASLRASSGKEGSSCTRSNSRPQSAACRDAASTSGTSKSRAVAGRSQLARSSSAPGLANRAPSIKFSPPRRDGLTSGTIASATGGSSWSLGSDRGLGLAKSSSTSRLDRKGTSKQSVVRACMLARSLKDK